MGDPPLGASPEFSFKQKQNVASSPGKTLQREKQPKLQTLALARIWETQGTSSGTQGLGTVCPREEEVSSRDTGEHRAEKKHLRRKLWRFHG